MASQFNGGHNRGGGGIGQGISQGIGQGLPLMPPARPPSTLNPTAGCWMPGITTLQDLEASFIRATTTDPNTGELLDSAKTNQPVAGGFAHGGGGGSDLNSPAHARDNFANQGGTPFSKTPSHKFVAQGRDHGMVASNNAGSPMGPWKRAPLAQNQVTGDQSNLHGAPSAGGFSGLGVQNPQDTGDTAAPSVQASMASMGWQSIQGQTGSVQPGGFQAPGGGMGMPNLVGRGINANAPPFQSAFATAPGTVGMGLNGQGHATPVSAPPKPSHNGFFQGVSNFSHLQGQQNSGQQIRPQNHGNAVPATGSAQGTLGSQQFVKPQHTWQPRSLQNQNSMAGSMAGNMAGSMAGSTAQSRAVPIVAPTKYDPAKFLGQNNEKPAGHGEPLNNSPGFQGIKIQASRGISDFHQDNDSNEIATPTPTRAIRTSRLIRESPGTVLSNGGTATPQTVVPLQNSPYRLTMGSIAHPTHQLESQGQSAVRYASDAMVVHEPIEVNPNAHLHGLIIPKPMECQPSEDPHVINYKGQEYVLDRQKIGSTKPDYKTWHARSEPLQILTCGNNGLPPIIMALDPNFFPFEPLNECPKRPEFGVVRIKNIPFNAKRCEVIALFGKQARLVNDVDEPVHIIMDRVSSKTNDAFVEFIDMESATRAVERFKYLQEHDKPPRLGDRNIEMQLSSQAALQAELFPLARNVIWNGTDPIIKDHDLEKRFHNFRGFVSEEEMFMLVKHVDAPQRSPYSKDCPQRPYECLISTLKKMPWHKTEGITIRQRHAMYVATIGLIQRLQNFLRKVDFPDADLTGALLNRVIQAAMYCPGFSVIQRDNIACQVQMSEFDMRAFGLPRYAAAWRHLYGVRPKMGIPLDLIEWYIAVIREETVRMRLKFPPAVRGQVRSMTDDETDSYFGDLWVELWRPSGHNFDMETIAHASDRELRCIERVLRRALLN